MNKRENIICYRNLGDVLYIKNPRARKLGIRINARGEVRVSIPGRVSFRKAESFVLEKSAWILDKKKLMQERQQVLPVVAEGEVLKLRTREVALRRTRRDESLEDALWATLLREAKLYLPGRVEILAQRHGLHYQGLKIRRMTSRWGSCTARDSINLNSWLMMLPEHLSDYVILHELAHTRYKDHGKRFWSLLNQLCGGRAYELRKEIRAWPIMGIRLVDSKENLGRERDGIE